MAFIDTVTELEGIPIFGMIFSVFKILICIYSLFLGIGACLICYDEEEIEYCGNGEFCGSLPRAAFSAAFTFFIESLANILTLGFYQFFKQTNFSTCCSCQCINGKWSQVDICCLHFQNIAETNV